MEAAPPPPEGQFMTSRDLEAAQVSRQRRRSTFADLIQKAGMNPAEVDVTKIMSDEEQADLIRKLAAANEAKKLAGDLGRSALRDRLRRTCEIHTQTAERVMEENSKAETEAD